MAGKNGSLFLTRYKKRKHTHIRKERCLKKILDIGMLFIKKWKKKDENSLSAPAIRQYMWGKVGEAKFQFSKEKKWKICFFSAIGAERKKQEAPSLFKKKKQTKKHW